MSRLRVLLTEEKLNLRGGAALYLRDVALGLLRRGHKPVVYSPELGEVADELRAATIPVVSDLSYLAEEPEVIHGQNHRATMTALLHFSHAPAVFICHSWQETPILFPRVMRYVAVDEVCYDHLVSENGIDPGRVKLLFNFADLRRFKPRSALPATPKRALIFSNGVSEGHGLESIREACARANIELDAIGYGTETAASNPEEVLPHYDVVFAKARCAIEAMAVGCAVVACDVGGIAGMVTTENLPELRRLNFGRRSLANPLDPTLVYEAIRSYSAEDAARVSRKMRETAGLDDALDQLIHLYEDAMRDHRRSRPDLAAEMRAVASYIGGNGPALPSVAEPAVFRITQRPAAIPRLLNDETLLSLVAAYSHEDLQLVTGNLMRLPEDAGEDSTPLLQTAPLAWHYAAALPISRDIPADLGHCPAIIRIRFRVHEGEVGIGLLDAERKAFIARRRFSAMNAVADLFFRLDRLDSFSDLVIQSWERPEEALVEIQGADVYLVSS
jgi:hypothetical protein